MDSLKETRKPVLYESTRIKSHYWLSEYVVSISRHVNSLFVAPNHTIIFISQRIFFLSYRRHTSFPLKKNNWIRFSRCDSFPTRLASRSHEQERTKTASSVYRGTYDMSLTSMPIFPHSGILFLTIGYLSPTWRVDKSFRYDGTIYFCNNLLYHLAII